ncbi:TolC family protein [Pedobacter frigiditerrae]|uniref:TolC family protein n=1 Tax=Pedobacter frigiditerrae TaxID=2530452 RepID=A0A4R0N2I0_9SPHI|nr:TolC family protein [Pedobacter frigiditerrae]TCC93960.1 TolC family protein [Pedobacter frigiditerrae]
MMRAAIFSVVFFLSLNIANAQESFIGNINYPLLQKYVDLAKQNYPKRKMYKASELSAKAKVGVARATYLDAFTAAYNYRPDNSSAAINTSNPYTLNGIQLGIYFNLGILFRTPAFVRQAKEEHNEKIYQAKEYDILLESEVKQTYYEYLRQSSDLKVKAQAYTDNKASSDGLKYKFEKGEVTLDDYTKAKAITSYANSERLLAELNLLKAKDSLEALVGEKLENVK